MIRDDTLLYFIHETAGLVHPARQRGAIDGNLPPILDRIGIDPQNWIALTTAFEKNTNTFVGAEAHIESAALQLGYKRTPNRQRCKLLFG